MRKVALEIGKYAAGTSVIGGTIGAIDGLTDGLFSRISHRAHSAESDYYVNNPNRSPPRIQMAMDRGVWCALRAPIVFPALIFGGVIAVCEGFM